MLDYLLTILIFLPLSGSLLCLLIPSRPGKYAANLSLLVSIIQLVFIVILLLSYDKDQVGVTDLRGFQFVEKAEWLRIDLGDYGILAADYLIGVDGINVLLVALAVIILLIGNLVSHHIQQRQKGYFSLYLLLNASIIGCFVALDFLLFYLFFELMLLPMYFLIGLWGGPRREYASIKFFLYTLAGSLLILVVLIALAFSSKYEGLHIFNLVVYTDATIFEGSSYFAYDTQVTIWGIPARQFFFLLLFIGFAIKIPAVPLHTWLPDAHVEAPTPISVILAGLLLKTGTYGIIRAGLLVFPDVIPDLASVLAILGAISIVYAGMNALAQKDLKKMIAYSSISHMGFVLVGLAALTTEGFSGAIYQMISHGILSPLLFIIAGIIYDRTKDRGIYNYSGLGQPMPAYAIVTALAFFAALGLPGFSGFIAEIMVLLGAFKGAGQFSWMPVWPVIMATIGLLIGAAYFLWTFQRMFMGEAFSKKVSLDELTDITLKEKSICIGLVLMSLLLGIFPSLILDFINTDTLKAVDHILDVSYK